MDNLLIRGRMNLPVTTGIPAGRQSAASQPGGQPQETQSFRQVLEEARQQEALSFSKHAASRVAQREIGLTESGLERLNEGVRIARGKGLDDALILMDGSAFIVSAKNGTVITALGGNELSGKVITNIDGAVIL